jgi:hypothetical protein
LLVPSFQLRHDLVRRHAGNELLYGAASLHFASMNCAVTPQPAFLACIRLYSTDHILNHHHNAALVAAHLL